MRDKVHDTRSMYTLQGCRNPWAHWPSRILPYKKQKGSRSNLVLYDCPPPHKVTCIPTPLHCRRTSEQSTTTCNNTLTFSLLMMGHSRLPPIRAAGKYGDEGNGPHFFQLTLDTNRGVDYVPTTKDFLNSVTSSHLCSLEI